MNSRFEFSRADRVRKALMREISDIIRREVKEPRLANEVISVTDVELSGDLRHAKIFVSIFGAPEKQAEIMDILKEWTPQVRSEVGKRIRIHHTPDIQFFMDDSLERGSRITQLLDQISKGEV
jgi:ribosome-binding factor A